MPFCETRTHSLACAAGLRRRGQEDELGRRAECIPDIGLDHVLLLIRSYENQLTQHLGALEIFARVLVESAQEPRRCDAAQGPCHGGAVVPLEDAHPHPLVSLQPVHARISLSPARRTLLSGRARVG